MFLFLKSSTVWLTKKEKRKKRKEKQLFIGLSKGGSSNWNENKIKSEFP